MNTNNRTLRALILGDSGGIGAALATRLQEQGWSVVGLSRSRDGFDLCDPACIETHMMALDGPFDLVVVATGILAAPGRRPEKSLSELDAGSMAEIFAVNATGPALILRHMPRLLDRNRRSVVAVLTARVGSISDNRAGGWYSYRASKAAANQILRTAAIELGRTHPRSCLVALHPGTVETGFSANYQGYSKHTASQAADHLMRVVDTLTPDQSGAFFDWAGKPVPW